MASRGREGSARRAASGQRTSELLAACRLLALDVDGVLTDGRVTYAGDEELQSFHVRDGQGIVWLGRAGIQLAWISGRGSRATERRARELGVRHLHLRVGDKAEVLAGVQAELGLGVDATVAMGDDLPDLALGARAALLVAPSDAHELVREHAGLVTRAPGGAGAVRELAEAILRAQGRWDAIVEAARGRR